MLHISSGGATLTAKKKNLLDRGVHLRIIKKKELMLSEKKLKYFSSVCFSFLIHNEYQTGEDCLYTSDGITVNTCCVGKK